MDLPLINDGLNADEQARLAAALPGLADEPPPSAGPIAADDLPTLDVRAEVHARRHALIFEWFGALEPGTAFVLVNDHDPKPLYYQFAAQYAGAFTWDYLEAGPEVWRVALGRRG